MTVQRARTRASAPAPAMLPGLFPDLKPDTVQGTVRKVLFNDAERGWCILSVELDGGAGATVCGRSDPVQPGDRITAEGEWEVHATYGRQFAAKLIEARIPETTEGIVRYLSSKTIAGVGAGTAQKLARAFGDQLPEAMQSSSTLLSGGIPEKQAVAIAQHWALRKRYGRLLTLLFSHNLGPGTAQRIIDRYGDDTMRVVLADPYRLAEEVRGIGFVKADRLALSQGLAKDSPRRIRAAVLHAIQERSREGHCAAPRQVLAADVERLLGVRAALVDAELDGMVTDGKLVPILLGGREVLYEAAMRACEVEIAEALRRRTRTFPTPDDLPSLIDAASATVGITLHENQRKAVETIVANVLAIVTGNPGTGKTSTVRAAVECCRALQPGLRIALAAPTGRAAKRLQESTGMEAHTLHRLLEWSREGFIRNADNPLPYDLLIVDEVSMLDVWLTRDLLRALPEHARLILVGDSDQLPSVGPGCVLADAVGSGAVPVARLTRIFRQGSGSAIAEAARQINRGVMPATTAPKHSSDMWGIYSEDPAEVAERVVRMAADLLPGIGYNPLRDVQVLVPGHNQETGTKNLNKMLQARINPLRPGERAVEHKDREFRPRDRVIQVSNNYDTETFNGDIGNIVAIAGDGEGGGTLTVEFDGRIVDYAYNELDQLGHAYAVTIHKSQGSEFPVVITVITKQHYIMLRRNLIYTAVTRARKLCCLIGSTKAVGIAVRASSDRRLTGLAELLVGRAVAAHAAAGPQAPRPAAAAPVAPAAAPAAVSAPPADAPPPDAAPAPGECLEDPEAEAPDDDEAPAPAAPVAPAAKPKRHDPPFGDPEPEEPEEPPAPPRAPEPAPPPPREAPPAPHPAPPRRAPAAAPPAEPDPLIPSGPGWDDDPGAPPPWHDAPPPDDWDPGAPPDWLDAPPPADPAPWR